jgi:predicted Zn-dependent protease
LAPSCQEALFAILCDQAVRANPKGTLLTSMAGTWFAMLGELERGAAMIQDALERNPMLPDWLRIPLALGATAEGDPQKSADLVRDLNARDVVSEWLIIAAAQGLAGNKKEAHRALLRLEELGGDPNALIKDLLLEADLFSELQKGISAARASKSE